MVQTLAAVVETASVGVVSGGKDGVGMARIAVDVPF